MVWLGVTDSPTSLSVVFHWFFVRPCWRGGQVVTAAGGGAHRPVKSVVHAFSQGHAVGRCSVRRRAEDAIRAGTCTSLRRIVPVVALAIVVPARVAAARVRLNAMTARTSQAAFAVNFPAG